jgi:hypothetical protein
MTPGTGRWILQTGAVPPGVFYQYVLNNPLNTALAPVNLPLVSPAQAPNLRFMNMSSAGSTGVETVITAFYQQITFEDGGTGLTTVETQRPRLKLVQDPSLGAGVGEILSVADDAALEATVATFYAPAYQVVNGFHSKVLNFAGTPVAVTDDGTTTTVTISTAVAVAGWDQVLAAGNTSAGGGGGNFPTVNHADILTITDSAHVFLDSGAYILFDRPQNLLVWNGTTITDGASITYAGAGGAPAGAALTLATAGTINNSGSTILVYSGSATAGGDIQLSCGTGTAGAGGGLITNTGTGTGAGNDGGSALFNLGQGEQGGDFVVTGGVGTVRGSNITFTTGNCASNTGAAFSLFGALPAASGGGGVTLASGVGTVVAGDVGGQIQVISGDGWRGGGIAFTTGAGLTENGGNIDFTAGVGVQHGGSITFYAGAGTSPFGGGDISFYLGAGHTGGDFLISGAAGTTRGSNITFTSGLVAGSGGASLELLGAVAGGGGGLLFNAGNGVNSGGGINLNLGNASVGTGGGLTFFAGTSPSPNPGGGAQFTLGSGHIGGAFTVSCGQGVIQGGDITFVSGLSGAYPGATLKVLGGLVGGPKGYVSLNSWLNLKDEAAYPTPNPVGGGYLFSCVSGGVSTLYWKQGATTREVALV